MRTQIGIIGAGPAGLLLSHMPHLAGIESVILEARDRLYVEVSIRAGALEQGTADVLNETGLGTRMNRDGLLHHGTTLRFRGRSRHIDIVPPTGAKGINLAVTDVRYLCHALEAHYTHKGDALLDGYSDLCLRRI